MYKTCNCFQFSITTLLYFFVFSTSESVDYGTSSSNDVQWWNASVTSQSPPLPLIPSHCPPYPLYVPLFPTGSLSDSQPPPHNVPAGPQRVPFSRLSSSCPCSTSALPCNLLYRAPHRGAFLWHFLNPHLRFVSGCSNALRLAAAYLKCYQCARLDHFANLEWR